MRRNHGNFVYESVPSSSSQDPVEDENDRMTDKLTEKIQALKSLTIDIGNEVKYQDKLLHGMDQDFERTSGSLGSSTSRVLGLTKGSYNYYIIYLFLFSFVIFVVLWLALKFM